MEEKCWLDYCDSGVKGMIWDPVNSHECKCEEGLFLEKDTTTDNLYCKTECKKPYMELDEKDPT